MSIAFDLVHNALGLLSGSIVGFSLGLVGGGGSILAVPLMIYVVGLPSAHIAIGTSALAVAANAGANLLTHTRLGTVKWACASVFAAAGIAGAYAGSSLSKLVDGSRLLVLFASLMLAIAGLMFFRRESRTNEYVKLGRGNAAKLALAGTAAGSLSGFFGIGGGFLIVPGLMLASRMPIINAVGSSLVAVTAFGATAAANYAISGLVDWQVAGTFILGGVAGGLLGSRAAHILSLRRGLLNTTFAIVIAAVAIYMLARSMGI